MESAQTYQDVKLSPSIEEALDRFDVRFSTKLRKKAGERLPEDQRFISGQGKHPKHLTDRYMQIARLYAAGNNKAEVARRLGVSALHVGQVLNSPIVQDYVKTLRKASEEAMIQEQARLMSLTGKAISGLEEILENGTTDQARLQAANSILDRNPSTSKHTKQTIEKHKISDDDIARWRGDVLDAASDIAIEDARYEDLLEPSPSEESGAPRISASGEPEREDELGIATPADESHHADHIE